jgi:hypothetical protein
LPVEVDFGVRTTGQELEAVMWAAFTQPLRDDLGVGFEDHGQIRTVSLGVELPEKRRINTVKALHDQAGRDVPIADDRSSSFEIRPDLLHHVVVAVGRVQAGQRMPGDRLGQLATQVADRPHGRLGRDMNVFASSHLQLRQVVHDGGLPGTARAIDADE